MFCLCGLSKENNEQEHVQNSHRTTLQSKMRIDNYGSRNSLNITQDCNRVSQEYTDFLCEYDKNYQEKSYFFNDYDRSPCQKLEESKTDFEGSVLMHQGDGLLVKSINVNQQSITKLKDIAFTKKILSERDIQNIQIYYTRMQMGLSINLIIILKLSLLKIASA